MHTSAGKNSQYIYLPLNVLIYMYKYEHDHGFKDNNDERLTDDNDDEHHHTHIANIHFLDINKKKILVAVVN